MTGWRLADVHIAQILVGLRAEVPKTRRRRSKNAVSSQGNVTTSATVARRTDVSRVRGTLYAVAEEIIDSADDG